MTFKELKVFNNTEIKTSETIIKANNIIQPYNWQFVHPYTKMYKVNSIINKHNNGTLTPKFVTELFLFDFFDLNETISFIDGFFIRSKYMQPFAYYLEYSLILCFQQDYAGAINLVIPSIEGILASYLTQTKKIDLSKVKRYEKIKKVIDMIKEDLIEMYISNNSTDFNKQQRDLLIKQERRYLENWFVIINSFLNESVFANTNKLDPNNLLNRHTILHQLKTVPYHSVENYIKLFNSLKFIFWIFSKIESISMLNQISDEVFIKKRIQYEALIKKSHELIIHKHAILKSYSLHQKSDYDLKRKYNSLSDNLSMKQKMILALRRKVDEFKSKNELGG